jgi:isoquinoline 1-oxidoreductase beta subunit
MTVQLSRRSLLKSAGASAASLVLGFTLPGAVKARAATGGKLNAWLEVTAEGKVRIAQPQSEMGQGIWTSMGQLVAEELEVDWDKVEIYSPVAAPDFAHPFYKFQTTAESLSIRSFWEPARLVGAQAREMLKMAAGEVWGVYPGGLKTKSGHVVNPMTGQKLPYGALVAQAAKYKPPKDIRLKLPHEWKIIGKPIKRSDTPAKVDGSAVFGIDKKLDGLKTAVPLFAPSFTGKVKSVDDAEALKVKGVRQVVPLDDVVYVVADGYWPARKGVDALKVEWDLGAGGDFSTEKAFATFHAAAKEGRGATVENTGDADAALAGTAKIVDVTLEAPYLAHATMEPMNATAHYTGDKLTIWAPTQAQGLMGFVAGAVGLDAAKVECHTTFLGGGLGRRFEIDLPIHAALVSKAAGAPVKVLWGREEDMRRDFYRPGAVARMRAAVSGDGTVTGFRADLAASSILARAVPDLAKDGIDHTNVDGIAQGASPAGVPVHRHYAFGDHAKVVFAMENTPIPVGFWRSVAHSQNGWFMEAFINEVAEATGKDPVELRLSLLKTERQKNALRRLAEKSNWGKAPDGRYQGIAIHDSFGSIVGQVVEIEKTGDKSFRIARVTSVADVGTAVNPDTIKAQIESGIITGLTAALYGQVTMANGVVDQGNFHDYEMMKLADTPEFDVEIIANGDPIGGVGEPGTPPAAPALVDALARATGQRLRSLPLAAHGFRLA